MYVCWNSPTNLKSVEVFQQTYCTHQFVTNRQIDTRIKNRFLHLMNLYKYYKVIIMLK